MKDLATVVKVARTNCRVNKYCKADGMVIDGYHICELLGKGRFASVYGAKCDGVEYALKIYRADHSVEKSYRNEVRIYNHLAEFGPWNANLVQYVGTFAHVDICADLYPRIHPCTVFKYAGCTVEDLVNDIVDERNTGLPLPVAKRIMRDVLSGLSYLHSRAIIHTDIKPGNILLGTDLRNVDDNNIEVRIGDLGSSIFEYDDHPEVIGTTSYLSPEAKLELGYNTKTDVWSAFVMFYELITGSPLVDMYGDGTTYGDVDSLIYDSDDSDNEDDMSNYRYLLILESILGPAPKRIAKEIPEFYRNMSRDRLGIEHIGISELLRRNTDLGEKDRAEIAKFMMLGLTYDPKSRISCEDALKNKWLNC